MREVDHVLQVFVLIEIVQNQHQEANHFACESYLLVYFLAI